MCVQCYSKLTEWEELEKAAMMNVGDIGTGAMDKIWDDPYHTVSSAFPLHVRLDRIC